MYGLHEGRGSSLPSTPLDARLTTSIKNMLSEIGLMQCFDGIDPDSHLKAFKRFQDIYHQRLNRKPLDNKDQKPCVTVATF